MDNLRSGSGDESKGQHGTGIEVPPPVVSNYPREIDRDFGADAAHLWSSSSGLNNWLMHVFWLPIALSAWTTFALGSWDVITRASQVLIWQPLLGAMVIGMGNLMVWKAIKAYGEVSPIGSGSLAQIHIKLFIGNLIGFGYCGFMTLMFSIDRQIKEVEHRSLELKKRQALLNAQDFASPPNEVASLSS